jgi:hypothetical protein
MSTVTFFANISESARQRVAEEIQNVREYNAPGFNAFRGKVQKTKAGEKGLKIGYLSQLPGGHSTPTALAPDYNEPVSIEMIASYVYPVRYRLPMVFDHGVLRDYKNQVPGAFFQLRDILKAHITSALKRLNQNFYGDGTGSVAYSTATLAAIGSATLTGDTTPAVSAGHTKGTSWLRKGNWYHAVNATTGVPRGLFQVTTAGKTSCTINLTSGSITSGDPIVDINTYNKWFRGLAFLISAVNRTIQGVNTANNPEFNSFGVDLALAPLTFAAIEDLMTGVQVRNNDGATRSGKVLFLPPGQGSVLRKSGQNLRVYNDSSNVVRGIAEDIDFGTNMSAIIDSDMDEDRVYAAEYAEFGMLEEMELDVIDVDGREWRQLMGANNSGSDRYQRAIGWDGNPYRRGNAQASAYIYRASTTGVTGQVT